MFKNLTKKNDCNFCLSESKDFLPFFLNNSKNILKLIFLFKEFLSFFEVRRVDSGLSSNTSMRATTIAVKLDIFMGTSCNFE